MTVSEPDPDVLITASGGRKVEGGRLSAEQGDVIRAVGERAAYELGHLRSWPLDEDWESYRPPAEWDEPLTLPDLPSVLEARALG